MTQRAGDHAALLADYERHLVSERDLTPHTVRAYLADVTGLLEHAGRLGQTEVTQLRTAMASRATIEQAKGILMLLTSCSEQVAFELLAHMSSHTHRKVREVAQSIVDSASGHAPLPEDLRAILRDACPPAPRLH